MCCGIWNSIRWWWLGAIFNTQRLPNEVIGRNRYSEFSSLAEEFSLAKKHKIGLRLDVIWHVIFLLACWLAIWSSAKCVGSGSARTNKTIITIFLCVYFASELSWWAKNFCQQTEEFRLRHVMMSNNRDRDEWRGFHKNYDQKYAQFPVLSKLHWLHRQRLAGHHFEHVWIFHVHMSANKRLSNPLKYDNWSARLCPKAIWEKKNID